MGGSPLLSTVVETEFGWVGLAGSTGGIRLVTLPRGNPQDCMEEIEGELGATLVSDDRFGDLPERLVRYFRGEAVDFPDALDLVGATPFRRAVWLAARSIPFGETRSYRWLSGKIDKGRAARAVGQALGANPVPIIVPCHRIIGSDGGLCGFGGGLEMKERLLRLEGVERRGNHQGTKAQRR